MDETGQPGDPGPAEAGTGAESRDRARLNGWATVDNPWSNAGAALEPGGGPPSWRRTDTPAAPAPVTNGWPSAPNGWPDSRNRFADLLMPLTPDEPARSGNAGPPPATGAASLSPVSAPPYPYEGDLPMSAPPAEVAGRPAESRPTETRPTEGRPAEGRPADGRSDQGRSDARHAVGDGRPERQPTPLFPARPSYEPPADPYQAAAAVAAPSGSYPVPSYHPGEFQGSACPAREPGTGQSDRAPEALPQRVPAKPDVPTVPEPPSVEPTAETPALARIATHLRRDDGATPPQERPDGFDVNAILAAVRDVPGVQDASLRTTPQGAHSLRLDLADGADAAEVSRVVARILQERMGLAAAMQGDLGPFGPSPMTTTPYVPSQATAAAREQLGRETRSGLPMREAPAGPDGADGPAPVPPRFETPRADPPRPDPSRSDAPHFDRPHAEGPQFDGPQFDNPRFGGSRSDGPHPDATRFDGRSEPAGRSGSGFPDPARFEATRSDAGGPSEKTRDLPRPDAAGRFDASRGEHPRPGTVGGRATVPPPGFEPARTAREESRPYAGDVLGGGARWGTQEVFPEPAPARPIIPGDRPGPRVVIENVQVNMFGMEATVEVRLAMGEHVARGTAAGPAVDGYLLRLCAMATASAVDELLTGSDHADGPARCYVEHASAVPFGACQVAVVVLLLSCGGWVEQLAGSAVVAGDDRQAMVRATLAAVNRRLEALLS